MMITMWVVTCESLAGSLVGWESTQTSGVAGSIPIYSQTLSWLLSAPLIRPQNSSHDFVLRLRTFFSLICNGWATQLPCYCHRICSKMGVLFEKSFEPEHLKPQLCFSTQIPSKKGMTYFPVLWNYLFPHLQLCRTQLCLFLPFIFHRYILSSLLTPCVYLIWFHSSDM